jgi:hypothetical protein
VSGINYFPRLTSIIFPIESYIPTPRLYATREPTPVFFAPHHPVFTANCKPPTANCCSSPSALPFRRPAPGSLHPIYPAPRPPPRLNQQYQRFPVVRPSLARVINAQRPPSGGQPLSLRIRRWLGLLLTPLASGGSLSPCRTTLARECCLLSGILHSFRPVHNLRTVPHLHDRFRRDQVEVVHFVAVWTKDDEILDSVIRAVAVDVGDFKHSRNAESAMCTDRIVRFECEFPVVHSCHGFISCPNNNLFDPPKMRRFGFLSV